MHQCGVINIDKPPGLTSRQVVDRIVRLVRPAKVGHAGTLDPLATGVLVVCVGHATRLISMVQEGRKRYRGRFILGQRSDTDDITGNVVIGGDPSHLTENHLAEQLPEFIGRIQQVPPQFSAVHVNGQRAYDLARRGEAIELNARPVDVLALRVTEFRLPEFELEIECGSGTYVRSIGRDLGDRLGCGAVMTQLRRLSVGPFELVDAVALEELTPQTLPRFLQSPFKIVSQCPQWRLNAEEMIAVRCGQSIARANAIVTPAVEVVSDARSLSEKMISGEILTHQQMRTALIDTEGQLLGIGEFDPTTGRLHPRIVFPANLDG